MYIKSVEIKNIRSISRLKWALKDGDYAGWHVLIGDNGSGKSTVVRAIALALVGPHEAEALREDWNEWLTNGADKGSISLQLVRDEALDSLRIPPGTPPETGEEKLLNPAIQFQRNEERTILNSKPKSVIDMVTRSGWFSVAYGPFRRFRGGKPDSNRLSSSRPKLAAHLSVFGEDVALSESIEWLQQLQFESLENVPEGRILNSIRDFINQDGFLPNQVKLTTISSKGVFFVDANENTVTVDNMSDGYRSILSMTFEIIRQLQAIYRTDDLFTADGTQIKLPGVILVDEIDAHLHPTWQRRVGLWFRKLFPAMQFIVTTHSPLICQAAEAGSVWKLPEPGTNEQIERIEGEALKRLIYGDILDAFSTEVFGLETTRSETANELLNRLADLNVKEVFQELTQAEREEQEKLRETLPSPDHSVQANS